MKKNMLKKLSIIAFISLCVTALCLNSCTWPKSNDTDQSSDSLNTDSVQTPDSLQVDTIIIGVTPDNDTNLRWERAEFASESPEFSMRMGSSPESSSESAPLTRTKRTIVEILPVVLDPCPPCPICPPTPPVVTDSLIKSLYVDNFNSVCGNTAAEDILIRYALAQKYNTLSLYSVGTVLNTSTGASKLRAFIKKAHANKLFIDITFSTSSWITGSFNTWLNATTNVSERPDAILWEKEYYLDGGFPKFQPELPIVYNWAKSKTPKLTVKYYMPWWSDDVSKVYQFEELWKYNDIINFHEYRLKPEFAYVAPRLDSAGRAWKNLIDRGIKPVGSTAGAGIIYSSEATKLGAPYNFMGMYFYSNTADGGQNKTYMDAFNYNIVEMNNFKSSYKQYYTLKSVYVFTRKYYALARP